MGPHSCCSPRILRGADAAMRRVRARTRVAAACCDGRRGCPRREGRSGRWDQHRLLAAQPSPLVVADFSTITAIDAATSRSAAQVSTSLPASTSFDGAATYSGRSSLFEAPPATRVMVALVELLTQTMRAKGWRERSVKRGRKGITISVKHKTVTTRATITNYFSIASTGPQRGDSAVAMLEPRLLAGIRTGRWHVLLVALHCTLPRNV